MFVIFLLASVCKDRFGAIFLSKRCRLILPPLAKPPFDCFACCLRLTTQDWNFLMIFAHNVEHTCPFPQNFSNCKLPSPKKLQLSEDGSFSSYLSVHENLFWLKTWLDWANLAYFLIFFQERPPITQQPPDCKSVAPPTQVPLQPFKAMPCWNHNQLFLPLLRRRRVFALVHLPFTLASQNWNLICLRGAFLHYQLKTWLEQANLAGFFDVF